MQSKDLSQLNQLLQSVAQRAIERDEQKKKNVALTSKSLVNNLKINPLFIIDSREQLGHRYYFANGQSVIKSLDAGDYSLSGYEWQCAIERKTIDDYVSTIIHNRDRFYVELNKLQSYENKAIIIENNYSNLLSGLYNSKTHPNSIDGLTHSISYNYQIPIFYLSNYQLANQFTELYLIQYLKKKELYPNSQVQNGLECSTINSESELEQSIRIYSLDTIRRQIKQNKEVFKQDVLNQMKAYRSRAILLSCVYGQLAQSDVLNAIMSIIVDHQIPIICLDNINNCNLFKHNRLRRYKKEISELRKEATPF
jgi:DNA excision repair protein ERCC-4